MSECEARTTGVGGLHAFSPTRPLLLVTDFAPDAKGGGAVILRSLLTDDDRASVVWVTLSPCAADGNGRVISLARTTRRDPFLDATTRLGELRRGVEAAARASGATAAWIVAHGAAVRLAPFLVSRSRPVHVTVHDDPAWGWALLTRRCLPLAPIFARDLGSALRAARSVDVVSANMARRYRTRYGAAPSIIHRGLVGPIRPAPPYTSADELTIAVLGSIYGGRELKVLASAVGMAAARFGIGARLIVIGGVADRTVRAMCPPDVALEAPGHLDEVAGVARLAEAFLLYLCYPFARRGHVLRTTSFPTKLSTYVLAARPLLLHMPIESGVADLGVRDSPYANIWHSLSVEDGAAIIGALWEDSRMRASFHAQAEQVRGHYFELRQHRATLLRVLNALAT